jgi:hypothetical protein
MAGKRGRESATDMVRSLGLVVLIVGVVFFLARPPSSDAKKVRVVDPTADVRAFSAAVPGGAVPQALPPGWRSTVSQYDRDSGELRIGWVTPLGQYAEYAARPHATAGFLSDITGRAATIGTVDVAGAAWTEYRQDKALSLVRSYGTTTVVVGTLRDTASLDELRVLAASLAP